MFTEGQVFTSSQGLTLYLCFLMGALPRCSFFFCTKLYSRFHACFSRMVSLFSALPNLPCLSITGCLSLSAIKTSDFPGDSGVYSLAHAFSFPTGRFLFLALFLLLGTCLLFAWSSLFLLFVPALTHLFFFKVRLLFTSTSSDLVIRTDGIFLFG